MVTVKKRKKRKRTSDSNLKVKKKNRRGKKKVRKNSKKSQKLFQNLKIFGLAFGIIVVIMVVSILLTTSFGRMDGYSMMPEVNHKDIFTINKLGTIKNFDVVYLEVPNRPGEKSVRRVIGVPGDEIIYKNDELTINNVGKGERYLNSRKNNIEGGILTEDFTLEGVTGRRKVPADMYFVLGDNRQSSADSRDYGFVQKKQIIGKLELKIFPFSD